MRFSQRKLSWICLLVLLPKDTTPPILQRKLSWMATKLQNLQKFSPSKVSHYMIYILWEGFFLMEYMLTVFTSLLLKLLVWAAITTERRYTVNSENLLWEPGNDSILFFMPTSVRFPSTYLCLKLSYLLFDLQCVFCTAYDNSISSSMFFFLYVGIRSSFSW